METPVRQAFVEWMVGHENYDYKLNFDAIQKKNESFPGIDELSNFTTTTYSEGYKDTYRTEGYFTRARYDYNETYFAEASFRRDGSSIFHTDHRWGNFWSVGIGWMLSNEAFLKKRVVAEPPQVTGFLRASGKR